MHFYNFNVKDFNSSTRHLTHLERALFRDLIDMYYVEEKAITSNMAMLERKLLVHTEEERQALKNVLADFFTLKALKGDGEERYHIKRIDREIKNYRHRQATSSSEHQVTSSETSNEHQENIKPKDVHYKKVSMMVNALKNKGIKANMRMKMADLQALFDEHCNQTSSEHQVTSSEHQETSSECQVPFHESITNNHKPLTNNQEPITKDYVNACEPTNEQTNAENILNLWRPTLKQVNDFLKISGLQELTQTQFEQLMPQFLAFYADEIENKRLSENKLFSKLVGWIKRTNLEKQPVVKPTTTEKTPSYDSRNVNKAWDEKPMLEIEEWSEERKAYEQAKSNAMLDELGFD